MNEAETRAEYIDPQLKAASWGEAEGSKIIREFRITDGKIQTGGFRAKPQRGAPKAERHKGPQNTISVA